MNSNHLIERARAAATKLYHEGNSLEKMNFHIGFLESTIRELVVQLNNTQELLSYATDEIKSLHDELRNLRND